MPVLKVIFIVTVMPDVIRTLMKGMVYYGYIISLSSIERVWKQCVKVITSHIRQLLLHRCLPSI